MVTLTLSETHFDVIKWNQTALLKGQKKATIVILDNVKMPKLIFCVGASPL